MSTKIKIAIIGGSGLDNPDILKNRTEKIVSTPYGSPSDALILGDIDSIPVVFLARHGRKHDIIPGNINYRANIWALKEEGCTHILATNACGSYIEEIAPGDLLVIDSFIDRTTNRQQTFYDGEIGHLKGICHMSMEPAFCQKTRMVILETAKDLGIKVRDGGTTLVTDGPRYESRAESNLFKSWGAHLVGMTSMPEVVLAKEAGICYAAICMVTAYGCWRKDEKVSHQRVLEIVQQNMEKVLQLLLVIVSRIGQANWEETIQEAKIGIIGGSGLDNPDILKNRTEKIVSTPYGSPSDALILGDMDGIPVVILARHGRKHDIMPGKVNYRANVWALKEEGCTHIVATNACGSLQEEIAPGDLVVIDNFIDRTTNRLQTFYDGEPNHPQGICHMPMEPAFCQKTREVILNTAKDIGVKVKDGGTITVIEGPRFSSRAESNLFRSWGAHLIGMTTVPEVVLAKEAGLCYAVICMATDYDCWRDEGEKVCHKSVLEIFHQNVEKVLKLLRAVVPRMGKEEWEETIREAKDLGKNSLFA